LKATDYDQTCSPAYNLAILPLLIQTPATEV